MKTLDGTEKCFIEWIYQKEANEGCEHGRALSLALLYVV